jgi:hyperosmotically inducible periplasmic protein
MNWTRMAILSVALMAAAPGCRREEPKPAAPPPAAAPQTAPQPTPPPTATPGTTEPGRSVGEAAGDAAVTARVKAALLQADDVKGLNINVDTVNGVVALKGTVDTQAQADRAVSIAKVAEGVKEVRNELTVKGSTGATK